MGKYDDLFTHIKFAQRGRGAYALLRGLRRVPAGIEMETFAPIYYLTESDLVACSSEAVTGDAPNELTDEVTSRVGTEIRDNLTKVFAASSFDVKQLYVVVTRRHEDGILICDVTIEAVDNST